MGVGLIEFLEQLGSELFGGGSSHDLLASLCVLLITGHGLFVEGKQLLGGERLWMLLVGIQGRQQSRPFCDHTHPDMRMTMNPSLVTLGQTEKAFRIQVVLRHILPQPHTHEQTHQPTRHPLAQLLLRGHFTVGELLLEPDKPLTPSGSAPILGVERRRYSLNVCQLLLDLDSSIGHLFQTRVDARDQRL
jgi:hypothetical protein